MINLKNRDLAVKLFKLSKENDLDLTEKADINDYFMFLTLDLMKGKKKEEVEEWVSLFEGFDDNSKFFFTLAQMLSLKHEIGTLEGDMIKREYFEESLVELLKKFNLCSSVSLGEKNSVPSPSEAEDN